MIAVVAGGTVFAAMRGDMVDRDYMSYFTLYRDSVQHAGARGWTEFGYFGLQDFFSSHSLSFAVFLAVIALIAVGAKVFALHLNDREHVSIGLAVYFATYLMLHDMTQIRVSVSSGMFLLSLVGLRNGRKFRFILFNLVAIAFHSSGVLGFVALALRYRPRRFEAFFFSMAPFVLALLGLLDMLSWPAALMGELAPGGRLELYSALLKEGQYSEINLLSIGFLILATLNAFFWFSGAQKINESLLYRRVFSLGVLCYPLFSALPVLAFRTSEYLCIVVLFLAQSYCSPRRYPMISIFFLLYLASALYVNVVREDSLLAPYSTELHGL